MTKIYLCSWFLMLAIAMPAIADSGSDAGSGSAVVVTAGSGSGSAATPAIHDVTVDPASFIADVKDLWHKGGWSVGVMLLVVGALELIAYLGKNNTKLAWLGKGRISVVVGGATGTLVAMLNVLVGGGAWSAALMTGAGALLAIWHPAGTDPAKA